MRLDGILTPLKNSSEFIKLRKVIEKDIYPVNIVGFSDSSRAYLMKVLYDELDKPLLVLTYSDVEAKNIYERSEEHTSELQSRQYLVCRLLLEKKHYVLRLVIISFS